MGPELTPKPMRPAAGPSSLTPQDEIELPPPTVRPPREPVEQAVPRQADSHPPPPRRFGRSVLPLIIAALALTGWLFIRGSGSEASHPGWQHVAAAEEASRQQSSPVLVRVAPSGTATLASTIELRSTDLDLAANQTVRSLLASHDVAAVQELWQSQAAADPSRRLPQQLNSDVLTAVREGRANFFQLYLFDSCDEDGDLIQLLLNGQRLAETPLTHQGTVVSIPLTPGTTTVTLRGVHDGGGGITVLFRTSQGDYFCRSIDVGEEYQLQVVVP